MERRPAAVAHSNSNQALNIQIMLYKYVQWIWIFCTKIKNNVGYVYLNYNIINNWLIQLRSVYFLNGRKDYVHLLT